MISKIRAIPALLWIALCSSASAQASRVVVIKLDGVPAGLLEEVLHEKDPLTGKSRLPWIDEVFARHGVRLANFYVRGISLSAPSWAMLDTGRHQRIHGNVEYDRLTLITYDYLNFFPFYFGAAGGRSADMPGVEVLDASGVPLVVDRFPWDAKYQGFQLFQRGVRWKTMQNTLQNRFLSRSPRELFDELQTGFEFSISLGEQTERELIERLADNHYQYLDYFSGDFDHLAHLTNDRAAQVGELRRIDATVGRIWTAIQNSPLAAQTVLAVVSDHGINSTPGTYSQGYSFVDWFRSATGGGHHVVTDRYPLTEFRIKGVNPFTSEVITPSRESPYLKDEVQQYPTVFLDLDGNERAAVQFRNSDLNTLHLLLKQMARKDFPDRLRGAASETFFDVLDSRRELWSRNLAELQEELGAVRRAIESERAGFVKRKWTPEERVEGLNQPSLRRTAQRILWEEDEKLYREYARVMSNLLTLKRGSIDPHVRIEELIPKRSLGEPNTIFDLQNYTVGPSREGFIASEGGEKLDQVESFRHMNYLSALPGIAVRNNVQKTVSARPVDFVAARVPEGVLLYADEEHQAVVLNRQNDAGQLELRYVPVGALRATGDGAVSWSEGTWKADLPLRIWEDADLRIPAAVEREAWLGGWHTDREWLEATCRTRYSNGIVGVHEQFVEPEPLAPPHSDASEADSKLLMRFAARRRRLVEPELLILANDHWNFNIRSFNPGGNHGSFFQISTHSVLMFAGGEQTGIPQAMVVQTPYDSLSFAPTLLKLAGRDITGLPGPPIAEVQRR